MGFPLREPPRRVETWAGALAGTSVAPAPRREAWRRVGTCAGHDTAVATGRRWPATWLRRMRAVAPWRAAWATTAAAATLAPSAVAAELPGWVVVVAQPAGYTDDAVPAAAVERSLRLGGAPPLEPETARSRFVAGHSDEPSVITPSDVAALERCYHEAGLNLARGRVQAAGEQVQRCIERANEVRETLVRDANGAQQFLRACAVQVQYFLQAGRGDDALRQATDCRLVASDVPLNARAAPPEVRAIFEAADRRLASQEPATIEVRSAPRQGCAVWLRGQNVGRTPVVVPGLLPGKADLQVECTDGEAGRVHRVEFRSGRNLVTIDTRFERVIRTTGRLRLVYPDSDALAAQRVEDAVTVGRAVGVGDVVIASLAEGGRLLLERVDVERGRLRGRALLTLTGGHGIDDAEAARASQELDAAPRPEPARPDTRNRPAAAGSVADGVARERAAGPSESGTGRDDELDPSEERGEQPRGVGGTTLGGVVLGGVGAVGLGAGWVFYALARDRLAVLRDTNPLDVRLPMRQDAYDEARLFTYLTGGAGALALTVALPLLVPRDEGVPPWAWVAGGVGAVGLGLGVYFLATDGQYDPATMRVSATADLGAMFALTSTPLLGVPITYLVRTALGPSTSANVEPVATLDGRAQGLILRIGGVF